MKMRLTILFCLLSLVMILYGQGVAAEKVKCGPEPAMNRRLHKVLIEAQEHFHKKEYAQAIKKLDAQYASGKDKPHHRLAYMRGMALYSLSRRKEACRDLKAAVAAWPCFGAALSNLAVVQYELGRPLESARTASRAYGLIKPPNPELAYMAAVMYMTAGQPKRALPYLKNLAKRKDVSREWLVALTRAYMDLKQWEQARKTLKGVLARYKGDAQLWRLMASLEMRRKAYASAAAALETSVGLEGARPGDWSNLAQLHCALGAPAKAAEYYKKDFGETPSAKQWMVLARTYYRAYLMDQATAAARRAADLQPTQENLIFLAETLMVRRAYAQAREAYLEAARRNKGERAAKLAIKAGCCALRLDELEWALDDFNLAESQAATGGEAAKEAGQWLEQVQNQLEIANSS